MLATGMMEHGLDRQRRQDRQVGILGLPAPARAPLGLPRLDRLVRKPDRQAATPAQALVVIAPVRDLALLLRDVAASVLVQLEGQGGHPGSDEGPPCYLDRAPGATRGIPATTWSARFSTSIEATSPRSVSPHSRRCCTSWLMSQCRQSDIARPCSSVGRRSSIYMKVGHVPLRP